MRIIALSGILAFSMTAQTPAEPPPLVQLIRKSNISAAPVRPYAEARAAVNVIGMTAVTGMPETWLVEAHQSFASIEELDKAASAATAAGPASGYTAGPAPEEVLPPGRTMIALYRPDWSYRSDQAVRLFPTARYFHVSIYRIRPGTETDFGELVRLRRLGMDKANLDRPDLAYQVISGAPSGTYVFLAPLATFRALDDALAKMPLYFEAVATAGTPDAKTTEAEISREHLLFRVEPRISYVSDDFAAADPGFWRGTPKEP
jgi:hypothetical protein